MAIKKKAKEEKTKASKNNRGRVSRAERIERKLKRIEGTPVKIKDITYTVKVHAICPVEIPGYIQQRDDKGVIIRHKKSNGGSRTRLSSFSNHQVIEIYGNVKEPGSVTVMKQIEIRSVTGKLVSNNDGIIIISNNGEESLINTNTPGITVEMFADEESTGVSNRGKKKKKEKYEDDDGDL